MTAAETFDVGRGRRRPGRCDGRGRPRPRAAARVLLLDRAGRIKPCGGAIPPRLIRDFAIPDGLLVARVNGARMVSPKDRQVDMPIEGGFVGMVDRERVRRVAARPRRRRRRRAPRPAPSSAWTATPTAPPSSTTAARRRARRRAERVRARTVIGADGAMSPVARQAVPGAERMPYVFAYHEIVRAPRDGEADFDAARCDVYLPGALSPDFYAWVFPHGDTASIGTGSAHKGFSLRGAVGGLARRPPASTAARPSAARVRRSR